MSLIEVPEAEPIYPTGVIGVYLGIRNVAVSSDGNIYSGDKCTQTRIKCGKLRAILQQVGTKSAKNHLRKLSGTVRRFKKDVNHCISKEIIHTAKGTISSIALEDLYGIRTNSTVNKAVNAALNSWAFLELRKFIE